MDPNVLEWVSSAAHIVLALQTLIIAVGETVYTVASVLTLLFLLMFVFAILGFCLFGVTDRGDLENWGNLASAFFTLFSLATVLSLGTLVGVESEEGGVQEGRVCVQAEPLWDLLYVQVLILWVQWSWDLVR
jgi:hypothetical protein